MAIINAESIEDDICPSNEETYIQDLEAEIDSLRLQVKRLKATKNKPKPLQQELEPSDLNCCKAYKVVLGNFNRLLDEILPF